MIRIRAFNRDDSRPGHYDSVGINETLIRVNRLQDDPDYGQTYVFTANDDYTHAIVINTSEPELLVPAERVLGLAWEPPAFLGLNRNFLEYAANHIGRYLIGAIEFHTIKGETQRLAAPFIERYAYIPHNALPSALPEKSALMSIMVSKKIYAPGHRYRHELVKRILASDLPIDIYGYGCGLYTAEYPHDPRLRGAFQHAEGVEMQRKYVFHICIENYQLPEYMTEKLTDTLIWGAIPVYLGCARVEEYLPGACIHLTGEVDRDMSLLADIVRNRLVFYQRHYSSMINARDQFFREITLKREIQLWSETS